MREAIMKVTPRQIAYLALAAIGLIATWFFNIRFMAESGGAFDVVAFVRAGYANSASSSLSNDLLVGCVAFLIWSFVEVRRLAMRRWWVYPILTFAIAFAFAFPLFLFLRDRRLQAREHSGGKL
jgi:Terpene cyclase DEP1